ncbi:MAG TPA: DUF6263 family protein [Isosphaeraceae bacterium]|nr:DUF6263 family protein [Isosphaeraceae bacterium]
MKRMMVEGLDLRWPVRPGAMLFRIVLSALAATLGVAAAKATHGAETLRWKFKPGETLRYTMVQQTTQEMKGAEVEKLQQELQNQTGRRKAMGQDFKTSLNQTVDLHWSVKNVASDGVAELSQTIDRVRIKVEGPGNSFEFDSQAGKDPEGPIASQLTPMLKGLVGAEFTFKMNGRGELSEIKVPRKLLDSLRQAGPPANAGGMFSEEGMKNMISQSSLTLAEGPLEKGESWTQQAKVPVPPLGTMVLDKTYTFDGPSSKEAGLDLILLDTNVTLEPAADSDIAVKITSQKGTGEFAFDPQAGRVVSSRVNDKLQMSLSVKGQELEQSTDTVTSMTLAKDGSAK